MKVKELISEGISLCEVNRLLKKYQEAEVTAYYKCPLGTVVAFKGFNKMFVLHKNKFKYGYEYDLSRVGVGWHTSEEYLTEVTRIIDNEGVILQKEKWEEFKQKRVVEAL